MRKRAEQGAVRWVVIAAILGVVVVAAMGAWYLNRPSVTITTVVEGPVVNSFYATGTVEPVTEYPIKTSNAGSITKIFVDKGDRVTKGQELAIVEDPQLKLALDRAQANSKQATLRADEKSSPVLQEFDAKLIANASMLDNAKHDEQRFREAAGKGGASQSDMDKAADHVKELWSQDLSLKAQREAAKIQLQTDLEIARASVAAAQTDFDRQTLRSPIDGVVLDRPAPLGTRVAVNVNDHVMQVADVRPENLVMRAQVDEENFAESADGQIVEMVLYSFPGHPFEGKVQRRYDKADPDRRTFEVDVKFTKPDPKLAAGMTGELAFIIATKDRALVAPAQALQRGAIFTVRDGRLLRVDDASVGIKSVERIELLAGFKTGDPIVISAALDIPPGTMVRVHSIDPKVAAGLNSPKNDSTFHGFN